MKEFIITWSIENIGYSWQKTGYSIDSPEFFAGSMLNTIWTLQLYPRGIDDSDYLSLQLRRQSGRGPDDLVVNFEFSCICADTSALPSFIPETSKNFSNSGHSKFLKRRFLQRCEVFGRRKALYLPKDILTLRCRIWKDEEDVDESQQIFGCTRLTIERVISVQNIYPEKSVEKTFEIQSKSKDNALMSITVLYFDDKIHVRLNPISQEKMKFSTCKLTLLNDSTGRELCKHISCYFGLLKQKELRLNFSDKVPHTENRNASEKCYDFITEIIYSTGETDNTVEKNCQVRISEFLSVYIISSGSQNLSKDLWNFGYELWDVKLKTQDKTFQVHKTVLCARSPVFTAMLISDMKENRDACVEIEDISAETLGSFLLFLYTDFIGNLEYEALIDLYYAADKYGLELLKLVCCSNLLMKVAVENVCELLMLADKHQDRKFEQKILDLISKNDETIFKSSSWEKFACEQENYKMALKTMRWKYEEKENLSPDETFAEQISSHPKIADDFRTLYQCHIASDVVIKSASKTFPAHKIVLCASSITFKEVFAKESTDSFQMGDWDDVTVSQMLLFMYTDSLEDIQWDSVIKLYQIANAYKILRLRIKCSCFFLENIKVANASTLLLLAHEYNDVELKSVVEDYICLYDEEIFGSDEWVVFSEAHVQLANETMRANDVVLISKGTTFPANKTILCASSSIFKEVFNNHLGNESFESNVLGDWDEVAVSRLLCFLRSDSLGYIQWDSATKLYQLADAYQKCSHFLLENLSVSKVTQLLLLAHEYVDVELKSVVEDYICMHEEIFGSDKWSAFNEANVPVSH